MVVPTRMVWILFFAVLLVWVELVGYRNKRGVALFVGGNICVFSVDAFAVMVSMVVVTIFVGVCGC